MTSTAPTDTLVVRLHAEVDYTQVCVNFGSFDAAVEIQRASASTRRTPPPAAPLLPPPLQSLSTSMRGSTTRVDSL